MWLTPTAARRCLGRHACTLARLFAHPTLCLCRRDVRAQCGGAQGLNVFNTACVLAKPSTATDDDYERVQGVVGHEYFHNWSGNRVTCRDWFQLTLKEARTRAPRDAPQ